jgi:hypothetical protein
MESIPMRLKSLLFSAAFALAAVPAQAQFLGQTTIVTPGPGVVMGAPTVFAPTYGATTYATTVVSPYSVMAPGQVVVRRSTVLTPTIYGGPAIVGSPYPSGPVLLTPTTTVVRPGWGWGPAYGPRYRGWRRW